MHESTSCTGRLITLSAADVSKAFKTGQYTSAFADQLASVFTNIFNLSLSESVIPTCFQQTAIVPVPKNTKVTYLNDFRPIALTSVATKCFERLTRINTIMPETLDPLQFALPPQQIHRCSLYCTPHCPFPPGQKEHLCENAIH
jgi:hypothetical protein